MVPQCSSARSGARMAPSTTRSLFSTAEKSRPSASRSICRTTACSMKSGSSQPGRCRDRSTFAVCALASPSARTSGSEEVVETLAETGAEILVSPNGSPFDWPKPDTRMNVAVARVTESGLPLIYLNQVGGQDELVFDGASFVLECGSQRSPCRCRRGKRRSSSATGRSKAASGCASRRRRRNRRRRSRRLHGCMLGLRDYVAKNGFPERRARLVWRHRLGARRGARGGRARAGQVHAIMLPYRNSPPTTPRRRRGHALMALGLKLRQSLDRAGGRGA